MSKIGVFVGSFDPITCAHHDLILRALAFCDTIVVGIGKNDQKQHYFSLEQRLAFVQKAFEGKENILIESYSGATVDFCRKHEARLMIRGLRDASDWAYEKKLAEINRHLDTNIETLLLPTRAAWSFVSSSMIREMLRLDKDPTPFLPEKLKWQDLL